MEPEPCEYIIARWTTVAGPCENTAVPGERHCAGHLEVSDPHPIPSTTTTEEH